MGWALRIISKNLLDRDEVSYPVTLLEHQAREAVSTCSSIARWRSNKSLVHDGNLKEVFGKCSSL